MPGELTAGAQKYRTAKAKYWGKPVPPGLIHGVSTYAYSVYGCQCEICRPSDRRVGAPSLGDRALTHAQRQKKLRDSKRGQPVPAGVEHGKPYAYRVYACKCPVCVAARRADRHRQQNPWMYRDTRGQWTQRPDGVTVLHWRPASAGADWTCPDCGEEAAS